MNGLSETRNTAKFGDARVRMFWKINRWQVYDLNVLKSTVLLGNRWEIMINHSLTFNCLVLTIARAFSEWC